MRYSFSCFVRYVGVCSVLCSFSSVISAAPVAPPYVAEVLGNRVNVRAGSGTNYRILKVANKGDKLIVRQIKDGWARIEIPDGTYLYVSKKYVAINRKDHSTGIVKGSRINVRPIASFKEPPICQLNKNDEVKIVETSGDYYKIVPPAEAYAWISSKYTKYFGTVTEVQEAVRNAKKTNHLEKEFINLTKIDQEEHSKEPSKRNLIHLISTYNKFLENASSWNNQFKTLAILRRSELEEMQMLVERDQQMNEKYSIAEESIRAFQHELRDLEEKFGELAERTMPAPPPPTYLVKGVIKPLKRLWNRPGEYKLVGNNGKALCLLHADRHDLEEFVDKEVGINGEEQSLPGWNLNLVQVEEIDVLDSIASR